MSTWTIDEVGTWLGTLKAKTGEFDVSKVAAAGVLFVHITEAHLMTDLGGVRGGVIFRAKERGSLA